MFDTSCCIHRLRTFEQEKNRIKLAAVASQSAAIHPEGLASLPMSEVCQSRQPLAALKTQLSTTNRHQKKPMQSTMAI